ncbi:alpha-L-rhamnosidase C-terminal domain-containing protein [Agromyces sp. SYSU T00194]|uniref:alpha-L-rhamnosidase-related protein n=1 Tax=Agromyces chitinivorans TaxID=3158560 RepID=UPI0033924512
MPADTPTTLRRHLDEVLGTSRADAALEPEHGRPEEPCRDGRGSGRGLARTIGYAVRDGSADAAATWWYAPDQFELGVMHRLVREGFAANRFVHYAMNFGATVTVARYARGLTAGETSLELAASGVAIVHVDGAPVEVHRDAVGFRVPLPDGGGRVEVEVRTVDGEPPALAELGADTAWSVDAGDGWRPCEPRAGTASTAPHALGEPVVEVAARPVGMTDWEVDPPVLGRPYVASVQRPRIGAGETREEALATAGSGTESETRIEVVEAAPGTWTTAHEAAIRYLHVEADGGSVDAVRVEGRRRRAVRRGAFACSDDVLTRIWGTAARTLETCMQGLMVDGIKRDRMPWIGDHALGILANAFAAGDAGIARDSLVALGRPRHGFVNGIADYSLWWLIAVRSHLRQFGDLRFAEREAPHVRRFLATMDAFADADGVLRPVAGEDAFGPAGERAVFIDWGVAFDDGRDPTALQVLWFWAVRDGAEVLALAGADDADAWAARARGIRSTLLARAWDDRSRAWRTYLDGPAAGDTAGDHRAIDAALAGYPNFLAVLAGLESEATDAAESTCAEARDAADGRVAAITATTAGTPFMQAFALLALSRLGARAAAVARVRELWGGMLDAGASTFWEEFGIDADGGHAAMYGRPFGRSLAHAWASGPAALLPEAVLGIRPIDDGWRTVRVAPELGVLEWAAANVPTPAGDLFVHADRERVRLEVPAGVTVRLRGDEVRGPGAFTRPIGAAVVSGTTPARGPGWSTT